MHEDVNIIGAGRTDAGVHALGQVANFLTNSEIEIIKLKAALNGTLPKDIRIVTVEVVPTHFNARFDATKREYQYFITKRERAIGKDYSWCLKYNLDLEKIREASQFLIGAHDFQSFCKAKSEVPHYICNIESIVWEEKDEMLTLKIVADRFLHNMVRIIIGTMVRIGIGVIEVEDIKKIIAVKDRKAAGQTVPAKGLFLVKVHY